MNDFNILNNDGKLNINGRIDNKYIFKPNKKIKQNDLVKKYFLINKGLVNVRIDNSISEYQYKFSNNIFKIATLEKNIEIELLIIDVSSKNQIIIQIFMKN